MKLKIQTDKENVFTESVDYALLLGDHKLSNLGIWVNYIQIYER
jgi:hypothetical protein